MRRRALVIALTVLATACAGLQKECAQSTAGSFGSDWIVVQYAADGRPFLCWQIHGGVVESETGGNVGWQERSGNNHLVHITGWENRVQVVGGDFAGAGKLLGVDSTKCHAGVYPSGQ